MNVKNVDFTKADSVAALYVDHSLKDMKSLSKKLTNGLSSEEEKFRSIYKWVCNNIRGDYDLFESNRDKRAKLTGADLKQWNDYFSRKVFRILYEERKTVCTGYAYLVKALSQYAGLSCEVVDGYGRNVSANIGGSGVPNHSWNAIRLHGKWYLCDPTWSSGALEMQQKVFVKKYEDAYFLSDPNSFVRNHYPLDTTWMLLAKGPTQRRCTFRLNMFALKIHFKHQWWKMEKHFIRSNIPSPKKDLLLCT